MRQRRPAARALRAAGWVAVGLAGLALVVGVGVPLVIRGAVLARLVRHESRGLCGTVSVDGGHVGLGLAPALLFQRSFEVALSGVEIREPDGHDFFRARTVRAKLAVLRHPWRVTVERGFIADGKWRLVDKGLGEPITQALTPIPSGGRAQCGQPAPSTGGPAPLGSKLAVRGLAIRNVSVELSFPSWGVDLDTADAHGTVDVRGTADGPQILFDVRDIEASRGGSLRIGGAGERLTPEVPFDRVAIPRVAVTPSAPQDLLLEVKEARTDQAVLSGRSVFRNVFAPDAWGASVGMDLDARWTAVGQALARDAAWAAAGEPLAKLHAGARASLHGPFDALTGWATLAGKGASARARLLPHGRYTLDLGFDHLDTTPLIPSARRALLGGRLDGRVLLSARLGPRAAGASVSLDTIELALLRDHPERADRWPRRWVVSRAVRPRAPDELRLRLGTVALDAAGLRVEAVRAEAPGVTWAGRAHGAREPGSRAFLVRVSAQPESRVAWLGETFLSPPLVAARIDPGRAVRVEPFSVQRVGGGAIDAGGSVRSGGRIELWTAIRAYPLAHIPGLAGGSAPGRGASAAGRLQGRVDAAFNVGGRAERPSLSGTLALSGVRWAGQRLGGGRVTFDAIPDGTRFQGQLVDGIDVQGSLRGARPAAADVRARVALARMPAVRPALHLRRADGVITADLRLRAAAAGGTPRLDGEIAVVEPVSLWSSRWPAPITVPPARIEILDNAVRLSDLAVVTSGARADLAGTLNLDWAAPKTSPVTGSLRARFDGRGLGPWLPGNGDGSGAARLDARIAGTVGAPRIQGQAKLQALTLGWPESPFETVRVDGPLTIDDRTIAVGPLLARFQSGGWLRVAGPDGSGSGRVVLGPRLAPLPVSDVDLTVRGSGLRTVRPISGLSLNGLGLGVRVTELNQSTLRVVGDVQLGHDLFQLAMRDSGAPGESAPAARQDQGPGLADRVWVHLRLFGPEDGVTVGVPNVPDVALGARCLVEGPLRAPRITGEVKGSGLYSRAALAVADWFTPRNLRKCDIGPRPQLR